MQNIYYVYIMASQKRGTMYVGITNNIALRASQHREGKGSTFTRENRVRRLVYFEEHGEVLEAIKREKRLKRWNRPWKFELVEKNNPDWRDLWFDLNR